MTFTLLAPELRAAAERASAPLVRTRTGVVIGGAWRRPAPALSRSEELIQAALLDKKHPPPRPLWQRAAKRLIARFWAFC